MLHEFLIPSLLAVFLAMPAFASATMTSLSGSALAQKTPTTSAINLIASKSQTMTAKVTRVDAGAKTFAVIANGKAFTFKAPKQGPLPKVGKIVDITYVASPGGGVPQATHLKSSKSNQSE